MNMQYFRLHKWLLNLLTHILACTELRGLARKPNAWDPRDAFNCHFAESLDFSYEACAFFGDCDTESIAESVTSLSSSVMTSAST